MALINGKWYWVRHKRCGGESVPAQYKSVHGQAKHVFVHPDFMRMAELMEVIRPLEDPPEPPFEPGWYWSQECYPDGAPFNGKWLIRYWSRKPQQWKLGDKVEVPEKYK